LNAGGGSNGERSQLSMKLAGSRTWNASADEGMTAAMAKGSSGRKAVKQVRNGSGL
jgi:hypothetical protein